MTVSVKLLLGVFALSTVACAPKVTSAPAAVAVDETRGFDRHLTTRMREAFAEQNVPDAIARRSSDVAFLTRGGPPGQVTLEGALARTPSEPAAQVSVEMKFGHGRDGSTPKVRPAQPQLFIRQSDEARADLAALGTSQTYVNLGCSWPLPMNLDGLTAVAPAATPIVTIRAKVVLICDGLATKLKFHSLRIVADQIVVSNVNLALEGLVSRQLTLIARELTLTKTSVIKTSAPNDELTYSPGPSVRLSAERLSGDGHLNIESVGASFVPRS